MSKPSRGYRNSRCPGCQLPKKLCICGELPKVNSQATFWIVMHPFEYDKPTNTGRILKECLSDTKIIFWERTAPSKALIDAINSNNTYLVFPEEYKTLNNTVVETLDLSATNPHFILLDGTWKQARKIFRQSPYLHKLPVLSMQFDQKSIYQLRRPSSSHHLCTIEVAIALLRLNNDITQSEQINQYFRRFVNQYMFFRNGKNIFEEFINPDAKQ